MEREPAFLLGAVKCLPLAPSMRDSITQTIVQTCGKIKVGCETKKYSSFLCCECNTASWFETGMASNINHHLHKKLAITLEANQPFADFWQLELKGT
jgi:hypothetical protein